jgi:hypothetical protein
LGQEETKAFFSSLDITDSSKKALGELEFDGSCLLLALDQNLYNTLRFSDILPGPALKVCQAVVLISGKGKRKENLPVTDSKRSKFSLHSSKGFFFL